jgi:hypothetical protein
MCDVKTQFRRIEKMGYDNWQRKQEKKIGQNFDDIEYLERRLEK